MAQRPYILADTTWATVRDTDYDVAVLPWASVEPQGRTAPSYSVLRPVSQVVLARR
jgi:creatinine amidohydrolase